MTKGMSTYIWRIISVLLVLSGNIFISAAQQKESGHDKIFHGLFIDFDLIDPVFSAFNKDKFGLNASIQADLFHSIFPVVEIGYAHYDATSDYAYLPDLIIQPDNYKYTIHGFYYKIGVNLNLLKTKTESKLSPSGYIGIRYAISPFWYDIENLLITDMYWNETATFNANGSTIGQWGEVLLGVRTPVYKNFCLGADVRFKLFLYIEEKETDNKLIRQSYAPGFGNQDEGKWGFRYTISYFFPF
jgi:hypothetical protein